MSNLFLCLLNVFLMATGQILFKLGVQGKSIVNLSDLLYTFFSPIIIIAIFVYACTTALWLYILNRVEISFAYPIQSFAMPLVCIVGMLFFSESISITKFIGIVVITLGVIIISRG